MTYFGIVAAAIVTAAAGTGLARRYALARAVIDVPNERSSHTRPTPRGGGVAIVAAFLGGVLVLTALGLLSPRFAIAALGSGSIVAVIGFIDDHRSVDARWRLLAHFTAATWGIVWLGGLPPLALASSHMDLGLAGSLLATLGLIWLLNLYNFMDGIDGLAALEAVTVCGGMLVIGTLAGIPGGSRVGQALLAGSALGFLLWNFPPARIFMGDAGSGFVGLMIGLLAVESAKAEPVLLWSWSIMLGAFVVDATVTLVRRAVRGEKLILAHRQHAYQHVAMRIGRHGPVTVGTALINLAWLLPIGALVATRRLDGITGVGIAYAPLIALAIACRAGEPECDRPAVGTAA